MASDSGGVTSASLGAEGNTERRSHALEAAVVLVASAAFVFDCLTDRPSIATGAYLVTLVVLYWRDRGYPLVKVGGLLAAAKLFSVFLRGGFVPDAHALLDAVVAAVAIACCGVLLARKTGNVLAGFESTRSSNEAAKRSAARAEDGLLTAAVQNEKLYRSVYAQTHVALWTQDFSELKDALTQSHAASGSAAVSDLKHFSRFIETIDANNAAVKLVGATDRTQLLGPFDKFMPSTPMDVASFLRALKFGERFEGKGGIRRCDGQQIDVVFGIIFPRDSPTPNLAMVGMLDVTGSRRHALDVAAAKAELDRLFRAAAIDAVSASIAHEINQPLGAMLMNAQTALRLLKQENTSAAVAAIERTISNIEQATEIVQKIRFQTATHFKPLAIADVRTAVQETLRLMRPELEAYSVAATSMLDGDLPSVGLDRTELLQVLVNISRNAIQAMLETPADQRVLTIDAVLTSDESLQILISDTGCGFSSSIQPRMFETFFTTKSNGTGLGLAICKSIVEGRGGRLTAHSRSEGGATFSIVLPVLLAEKQRHGLPNAGFEQSGFTTN
jgi:signal transduction histidine kinase